MPRRSTSNFFDFNIPEKATRILNFILIVLILFVIRIWHLSVVQYESKLEEFRKPQRKVVVEPARRATIRDRFNVPLAINQIQYQASILYSQFRQIPAVVWSKDENGKKVKQYRRKEYISSLSKLLAKELQLDAERLEDLIYSKAAFYYHLPYVIKEELTEQEYYRLKMLEKDWVGIQVQRLPKRKYPLGKVGGDIIGYMGAINKYEYEKIIQQINALQDYLEMNEKGEIDHESLIAESPSEARQKLKELQELAYTVNDYVGKAGIEGKFETELRGYRGKTSYYSDARGNFLRELPGSQKPLPGKRILLTISSELQEFAERLLTQNERIRVTVPSHPDPKKTDHKQPWIKGSAIVAIDPNSGEVLAMASYPRFDPNDFISSGNADAAANKSANILRWFETEQYIGQIWDQKRPLERERYDDDAEQYYEDAVLLSWDRFLDAILPSEHIVRREIDRVSNVKEAIILQEGFEKLLAISEQDNPYFLLQAIYSEGGHEIYGKKITQQQKKKIEEKLNSFSETSTIKEKLDWHFEQIPHHYDKVLLVDLCRLAVDSRRFSEQLSDQTGKMSLKDYRDHSAAMAVFEPIVVSMAKNLFHENQFKQWRKENEKEFLKRKRQEEKIALVKYPKPYIDYLDKQENEMFKQFWEENKWQIYGSFFSGKMRSVNAELQPFIEYFLNWHGEISAGAHSHLPWIKSYHLLREIMKQFSTYEDYFKTLRGFQDLDRPLLGKYRHVRKQKGVQKEKDLASAFYPVYGYGYARSFAFRQAATHGSLFKLVTAYAALCQKHDQLEESGVKITKDRLNPLEIIDKIEKHGSELCLAQRIDGTSIPQHYKGGRLTKSQRGNIGRIDITRALEESSNPYFSLLASEHLQDPEDLAKAASRFSYGARTGIDLPAEIPGKIPNDLSTNLTGLYSMAIGQHSFVVTPLQASVMLSALANGGKVLKPNIVKMVVESQRNLEDFESLNDSPFPYRDSLAFSGIDFPLFTASMDREESRLVKPTATTVKRKVTMPETVRGILLDAMKKVFYKMVHTNIGMLSQHYRDYPEAISDAIELEEDMYGKTSTAEAIENIDLDLEKGSDTYTHVWFGGIAFNQETGDSTFLFRDKYGHPELVVVVYLKFGRFGKEATPIAAQIVKKWREIKGKYQNGA